MLVDSFYTEISTLLCSHRREICCLPCFELLTLGGAGKIGRNRDPEAVDVDAAAGRSGNGVLLPG
jgi:hypothetical protein